MPPEDGTADGQNDATTQGSQGDQAPQGGGDGAAGAGGDSAGFDFDTWARGIPPEARAELDKRKNTAVEQGIAAHRAEGQGQQGQQAPQQQPAFDIAPFKETFKRMGVPEDIMADITEPNALNVAANAYLAGRAAGGANQQGGGNQQEPDWLLDAADTTQAGAIRSAQPMNQSGGDDDTDFLRRYNGILEPSPEDHERAIKILRRNGVKV